MIRVLDLSHYNRAWDFGKARMRGIDGCILKASQGSRIDQSFGDNWKRLQDIDMFCGAYHYFVPSMDAVAQADLFCGLIQGGRIEMGAWLDLEYNTGKDPYTEAPYRIPNYAERVLTFLKALEERGVYPGIYTNPSHSATYLAKYEVFASYDLWIANPQEGNTRTVPNVPKPFWADSWRGWQYTWKLPAAYYGAPVDAIKGLDGSVFRW